MRGRGRAGRGESKFVLVLDAACYACSFTLCLSFSYLRSAVAASLDIKKFLGNATRVLRMLSFSYVGNLTIFYGVNVIILNSWMLSFWKSWMLSFFMVY